VSSQISRSLYRNRYVYLPDYCDEIDVPSCVVLTSYGRATMRDVPGITAALLERLLAIA